MKEKNILIAYDIACPRRLGRVHRLLKSEAIPVQYSLFISRMSRKKIQKLKQRLRELISAKEDDLRIYELPENIQVALKGRQYLPDDLMLHLPGVGGLLQG